MPTLAVLALALAVTACGDDDSGSGRDHFQDAAVDSPPAVCDPTGACTTGPQCGTVCCASGEQCVNGTCMCGAEAACLAGDSCVTGGPVAPSAAAWCGRLCCGPVSGVGCPI